MKEKEKNLERKELESQKMVNSRGNEPQAELESQKISLRWTVLYR